jgi:hypothetical protein
MERRNPSHQLNGNEASGVPNHNSLILFGDVIERQFLKSIVHALARKMCSF